MYDTQLTAGQKEEIKSMVWRFPDILKTAVEDWARFKVGYARGVFTTGQVKDVLKWYRGFPAFWQMIRPNFETVTGGTISPRRLETKGQADKFIQKLNGDTVYNDKTLGAVFVIAGIIIFAALSGAAAVAWGIGYVKEQQNLSDMIAGVTDGTIPPEVLQTAIEEQENDIFGDITGTIQKVALAVVAVMLIPTVAPALKPLLKKVTG